MRPMWFTFFWLWGVFFRRINDNERDYAEKNLMEKIILKIEGGSNPNFLA